MRLNIQVMINNEVVYKETDTEHNPVVVKLVFEDENSPVLMHDGIAIPGVEKLLEILFKRMNPAFAWMPLIVRPIPKYPKYP